MLLTINGTTEDLKNIELYTINDALYHEYCKMHDSKMGSQQYKITKLKIQTLEFAKTEKEKTVGKCELEELITSFGE